MRKGLNISKGAAVMEDSKIRILPIEEIMRILPHGYPFLFVDRVLELEPDSRIVCLKNVTINEPFFQGHSQADQSCREFF